MMGFILGLLTSPAIRKLWMYTLMLYFDLFELVQDGRMQV